MWPFKRKTEETRNYTYTAQMMNARYLNITGKNGVGDLTATVQTCIGLWEASLSLAEINGTQALTARDMAMIGRQLGTRGESVYLIGDTGLIPVSDWDLSTRDGEPTAYRITLPDTAGGRSLNVLAPEVLHFRIGSTPEAPWTGAAPLYRASLTAGLLDAVERALSDTYRDAPLGSQIVAMPEDGDHDDNLATSFRGQRGRVLLRESTQVTAAGGPAPQSDWKPSDLTPDLQKAMTGESLKAAKQSVMSVYGVLPALLDNQAAGPAIREGQRHLAQFMLAPITRLIAQEATEKLVAPVEIDVMTPTQAYDAGGRARAMNGVIQAMAQAKEAGMTEAQVSAALRFAGIE